MRIAVTTWTRRGVAGRENYLATIIPYLQAAGNQVALVSEVDVPTNRAPIGPTVEAEWCVASVGLERVVHELRRWRPDVVYAHGLVDPLSEERLSEVAPCAYFAHFYHGTCISGSKSFGLPTRRPCGRRFGWPCLLHYYPRRCGGLSPLTMLRDYHRQGRRLELALRYAAIITHSRRMEEEYVLHGVPQARVHRVPFCVQDRSYLPPREEISATTVQHPLHLVFMGRMTALKGGDMLLSALPEVLASLGRGIRVTFAGDGPKRRAWEEEGNRLKGQHQKLEISFTGWLSDEQRDRVLESADLLVIPSVWPEPFGMVGIEAGRAGVPAAGFAVGGIPDWLENGVNGFLASGDPPTARGLAAAVCDCVRDPATLIRLRQGAARGARIHSISAHLARIEKILVSVAASRNM